MCEGVGFVGEGAAESILDAMASQYYCILLGGKITLHTLGWFH